MTGRMVKWLLASAAWSLAVGSVAAATEPAPSAGLGGHRLQQIALTTRDLGRAMAFYRDVLGLPHLFTTNNMAFFDLAGTRLMIALDRERPEARATSVLYFDAPDFHATVAWLTAAGVSLEGGVETVQRNGEGELKLQQFRDPDGNALAVLGLVPAAAR